MYNFRKLFSGHCQCFSFQPHLPSSHTGVIPPGETYKYDYPDKSFPNYSSKEEGRTFLSKAGHANFKVSVSFFLHVTGFCLYLKTKMDISLSFRPLDRSSLLIFILNLYGVFCAGLQMSQKFSKMINNNKIRLIKQHPFKQKSQAN